LVMFVEYGETYNTVNLCTTFHRLAKQLNGGGPVVPPRGAWRGESTLTLGEERRVCGGRRDGQCTRVSVLWHVTQARCPD
jgi:hypothetical protein